MCFVRSLIVSLEKGKPMEKDTIREQLWIKALIRALKHNAKLTEHPLRHLQCIDPLSSADRVLAEFDKRFRSTETVKPQ